MDLSIIIPSYNTKALLERCLISVFTDLRSSDISFELIVVDNASKDGSPELLSKKYPQVQLVRNTENLGYGKANNQAIRKAKGEYVLLLNSDIVVQHDAVGMLYRFIKGKKKIFAGGKLFNEDGSAQASCGPFYTIPVVALMLFAKGDYWGATRVSPDTTRPVDWVSGACIIGQKSSFLDVGLFDEGIFMYMEDIDFLYRAKKKGYTVFFSSDARFTHAGAASSGERRTPVVNIYRGLMYFYRKHRGPASCATIRFMLTVKALVAIVGGRIMGKRDLSIIYEEAIGVV